MKKAITIMFMIAMILGIIIMTYMHESVHQIIFSHYGIGSEIKMFDGFSATTTPISGNYSNCKESCYLANEINEVVGYHLIAIYFIIGIGLFIIILFLENLGVEK